MNRRFQTTRWSLVLEAAGSSPGAGAALEWLCRTYWYPLYGFIRRDVKDPERARDLTQAYFLQLLEKDYLKQIDRDAGKFRSFLLVSLKFFLSNERARERAEKRRADDPAHRVDLDGAEDLYLKNAEDDADPEVAFEKRWAMTVVNRGYDRLGEEYAADGKGELFRALRGHITGAGESRPYKDIAERLDMSEGAVKVAVHRMRQRLGRVLRDEVALTVTDPAEVDAELKQLLQTLAG